MDFGHGFKSHMEKHLDICWNEQEITNCYVRFIFNGVHFIIHFYPEEDNHVNKSYLNLFWVYLTLETWLKIYLKINISQSIYLCSEPCSKNKIATRERTVIAPETGARK